jgi:hypothetical protein
MLALFHCSKFTGDAERTMPDPEPQSNLQFTGKIIIIIVMKMDL